MSKIKKSRRQFFKEATAAGVGIAVSGCTSKTKLERDPAAAPESEAVEIVSNDPIPQTRLKSTSNRADLQSDEFDFIVVGAGAGGAPLAARLALAGFSTCLIDAGGDQSNNKKVTVPALHPKASEDAGMSWEFFVKHFSDSKDAVKDEKHVNGKIFYPRAAAIGGCTAHNAMITMYNDNSDWSYIQTLAATYGEYGNANSWEPSKMRSYFELLERNRYKNRSISQNSLVKKLIRDSRHGYDGWLATDKASYLLGKYPDFAKIIWQALGQAGPVTSAVYLNDPNNWAYVQKKSPMVAIVPTATEGGVRSGPWNLLQKAQNEGENLAILTHALVTEVIIDDSNRAVGVKLIERGGPQYEAATANQDPESTWKKMEKNVRELRARKEVILAGGVFNTPQLLMMSGVGDAEHGELMKKRGRKFRQRLDGVGRNLQDRYEVPIVSDTTVSAFLERCSFNEELDKCFDTYVGKSNRKLEPYASNGVIAGIITKSKFAHTNDPDLFVFALPLYFRGYEPKYSEKVYQKDKLSWLVLKGHPAKYEGDPKAATYRGRVSLNQNDPFNPLKTPDINFNNFPEYGKDTLVGRESTKDLNAVYEGVEIIRKINSKLGVKEDRSIVSDPKIFDSEAGMKEFIRTRAWGHHASCTCPMGTKDDPYSVVDTNFRVRGIENLRIVDASVFPRIPGLFIVTPIYMISEKAAETIIKDHKKG